jgi:hypothetical protein
MKVRATVLLVSFLSLALAAGAQSTASSSPEAVVKEYMTVLQKEGMVAVSRYFHPDELKRFKDMLMPWVRKDASQKNEVIPGLFGTDATLASVEAMPAAQFMDVFMHLAGEQLKDVSFGECEIVGTVREKDMVHVMTRVAAGFKEVRINKLTVVSTKPSGKEWKLMLSGELEGMAAAISAQQ